MSDVEKKIAADKAAELLLIPDSKVVKFLGRDLPLRPLPVAAAKRLRRLPEKVDDLLDKWRKDETAVKPHEIDEEGADLYVNLAAELCQFYNVELTRDYISENATLTDLQLLVSQQEYIQGSEDFLFKQLKNITSLFYAMTPEKKELLKQLNQP